jgi:hypothetical protein
MQNSGDGKVVGDKWSRQKWTRHLEDSGWNRICFRLSAASGRVVVALNCVPPLTFLLCILFLEGYGHCTQASNCNVYQQDQPRRSRERERGREGERERERESVFEGARHALRVALISGHPSANGHLSSKHGNLVRQPETLASARARGRSGWELALP